MKKSLFSGFVLLIVIIGVVFSGCSAPLQDIMTTKPGEYQENQVAEKSIVEANNRFAFDLYTKLNNDPAYTGQNIFFSPFSISSVMAVTYEGAHGQTADEIQTVFHFPKDTPSMRQGFSGILKTVNTVDKDSALRSADALWVERSYPLLPEYTQTARQYYNTDATNLDIRNKPDSSVDTINKWVEERTDNKIQNLLSREDIDPNSTRLVITNAIYFSGTWVKQFSKGDTFPDKFAISSNDTVEVPMMMRSSNAVFNYAEYPDKQVIELPYTNNNGHQLSMIVILPKSDLSRVENSLNATELDSITQSFRSQKLGFVLIPKFSLETRYDLPETLGSMGMPRAFTQDADFSGMDGNHNNLYVDNVIHKAYIEVNEEGTKATAATHVSMKSQGANHGPTFYANHPFLFIIQDRENGNILFMGRVMNPNG